MRKYTLLVSVLVHASAVCVLLVAPLFGEVALPSIHDATTWVRARVVPPPRLGDPRAPRDTRTAAAAPAPDAPRPPETTPEPVPAPVTAPSTLGPEAASFDTGGLRALEGGSMAGGTGRIGFGVPDGTPDGVGEAPVAPVARVDRVIERAGGRVRPPTKIHDVAPRYPPLAMQARSEGVVVLDAVIGEDGTVRDVRVLRSIPLLDQAAIDAVRQWRFTPTILNDEPVSVVMSVTVRFTLR